MHRIRILNPGGTLAADAPMDIADRRRLCEAMLVARTYDPKSTAMQKQGRLGTCAPF